MKFKRAIVFLLCAALCLPLFACSKGGTGAGDEEDFDPNTEYTITYNVGTAASAAGVRTPVPDKVFGGKTVKSLPQPTGYTGYVFAGWFEGDTQFFVSTVVKRDWSLTAHWKSEAEMSEEAQAYEDGISSWDQKGHLYIHYKRSDHSVSEEGRTNTATGPEYYEESGTIDTQAYGDWGLWLWPTNGAGSHEGILFKPAKIDKSGAVYDILLDHTYTQGGWNEYTLTHKGLSINYVNADKTVKALRMQLFKISTRKDDGYWTNDGSNVSIYPDIMQREKDGGYSYHWFVNEGKVGSGKPRFVAEVIKDPYAGIEVGSATTDHTVNAEKGILNSNANNKDTYDINDVPVVDYDEVGVGYQVFIASFCDGKQDDSVTPLGKGMGDLRGVISKIEDNYFTKLNVDVLWLTPFQESTNYHGYDIKDYYSVDPRFGTLADYRELVYKAHKKGIKVVMDFVLNHTAENNPWFVKSQALETETVNGKTVEYRNFYNWINEEQYQALHDCTPESKKADKHECAKDQWFKDSHGYYFYSSFGSSMPELNYDYQPVRDAIIDVCNYWMEFGLDGFRLDAVKHIYMRNESQFSEGGAGKYIYDKDHKDRPEDDLYCYDQTRNLNFWREFNYRLKTVYPNAFLVGENLDGTTLNTEVFLEGIDSQFDFNMYYDITRELNDTAHSNYEGMIKTYLKSRDGDPTNSSYPLKGYKNVNPNYIGGQFTSNHDLPRAIDRLNATTSSGSDDTYRGFYTTTDASAHPNGEVRGDADNIIEQRVWDAQDRLRMYYAFLMTIPGITWVYYGDELGMTGMMQYTADTQSTSSTTSAPHEDRIYRQPMKWKTNIDENASFDIGVNDFRCELEGLNTTSYVGSVEAQDGVDGSILEWMRTLSRIRHEHPELINGNVTATYNNIGNNGSREYSEYIVQGTSGKIKVCLSNGSSKSYNANGKLLAWRSGGGSGRYWVTIETVA